MSLGKTVAVRVQMLDNTIHIYDVKVKSMGDSMLHAVMKDLNVLEADYFGIMYRDREENEIFLDPSKTIQEQIPSLSSVVLKFVVKFFPPDPGQLQEDYTRYLFALQIKQDIASGVLACSENTLAVLASYVAQADFGDWNATECSDLSYLKELKIIPTQYESSEMFARISDRHKANMGQTQAEADTRLLDIARRVEMYGLRKYPAIDSDGKDISLAAFHSGLIVFQGSFKIETFVWGRMRKLSFKKKKLLVKLKPDLNRESRSKADSIRAYTMRSRDACKTFWRRCIEHHAFFRMEATPQPRAQPVLFKRGSTFRYSGKTQKQLHELVASSNFRRAPFSRVSRRRPKNNGASGDGAWMGGSSHNYYKQRDDAVIPSPIRADTELNGQQSNNAPEFTSIDSSKIRLDSGDAVAMTTTLDGGSSWQVESENLHSGSVVTQQHRDVTEAAPISSAYPTSNLNEKTEVSSVHLHSGGAPEIPAKKSPAPLTSQSSFSSTLGVLSTRELKPSSSFSESRQPSSQVYFVAKEILMTERTYIKDLEVICKWFKEAVHDDDCDPPSLIPDYISKQLFGGYSALHDLHQKFLSDLEDRFASWEARSYSDILHDSRLDDLMLTHVTTLAKYLETIENGEVLISALEELGGSDNKFESIYREFELQKACYLPFSAFLLKPLQRLIHYKITLDNLLTHEGLNDGSDFEAALKEINSLVTATHKHLKRANNVQKMAQLRRDLIGVAYLLQSNRTFIREGSLYKLSRKGFQQRLFFLFSDSLLYTSKGVTSTNQFKVHAEMPLRGMIIEINQTDSTIPNCFSILSGGKTVIVAAATPEEMDKWLEDFRGAIDNANSDPLRYDSPLTSKIKDTSGRFSLGQSSEEGDGSARNSIEGGKPPTQQRSNATMHVCWHRNTSVSASDHLTSLQNQLSGYLLRKFKTSNGWQKLWVVFTNFCLFFYKSSQDDFPLASLPLLGYSVNSANEEDGIKKDFVFKLQFKTHVYFFRAESHYTFSRWMQVISSATVTSQRTRLFSRMESSQ